MQLPLYLQLHLLLLLSKQPGNDGVPHLRRGFIAAKVGMYPVNQPALAVICSSPPTPKTVISTESGALPL
jgi:hypothetical protein